jgi:hypothetical protein
MMSAERRNSPQRKQYFRFVVRPDSSGPLRRNWKSNLCSPVLANAPQRTVRAGSRSKSCLMEFNPHVRTIKLSPFMLDIRRTVLKLHDVDLSLRLFFPSSYPIRI